MNLLRMIVMLATPLLFWGCGPAVNPVTAVVVGVVYVASKDDGGSKHVFVANPGTSEEEPAEHPPEGTAVTILLLNGNEVEGIVLSYGDTFLILLLDNGTERKIFFDEIATITFNKPEPDDDDDDDDGDDCKPGHPGRALGHCKKHPGKGKGKGKGHGRP